MLVKAIKSEAKVSHEDLDMTRIGGNGRSSIKWYDTKFGCVSIEIMIILCMVGVFYACHHLTLHYLPVPATQVKVWTPCGTFIGEEVNKVVQFKGIRYATVDLDSADKTSATIEQGSFWCAEPSEQIKAHHYGNPCLQHLKIQTTASVDENVVEYGCEDCLFANVFVPSHILSANQSNAKVVVYIHGGGLSSGNGNQLDVSPRAEFVTFINCILISFNYRLLNPGQEEVNSWHDQIQLLKWVHNNIAHFGGNQNDVTLLVHDQSIQLIDRLTSETASLFHRVVFLNPINQELGGNLDAELNEKENELGSNLTVSHDEAVNCYNQSCSSTANRTHRITTTFSNSKNGSGKILHQSDVTSFQKVTEADYEIGICHKNIWTTLQTQQFSNNSKELFVQTETSSFANTPLLIVYPRQSLDYCIKPGLRLGRLQESLFRKVLSRLLCHEKETSQKCSTIVDKTIDFYSEKRRDKCSVDKTLATIMSDALELCPIINRLCHWEHLENCKLRLMVLESSGQTAYKPNVLRNQYAMHASKRWDLITLFGLEDIYFQQKNSGDTNKTEEFRQQITEFIRTEKNREPSLNYELDPNVRMTCEFWKLIAEDMKISKVNRDEKF